MQRAKTFRDLVVWQKAHLFVLEIYKYSKGFPREEMFGLTSQVRRASVSVAANIAEGFAKYSSKDKIRIMNIAQGSLEECKYYLILSRSLGFGENIELQELAALTGKLLGRYIDAIRNDQRNIDNKNAHS